MVLALFMAQLCFYSWGESFSHRPIQPQSSFSSTLDGDYESIIKPRYREMETYLLNWERTLPFVGPQRVPKDTLAAVSLIVRFREHLQMQSIEGILPLSDQLLMEFLDEQSLWLYNHMRNLDRVGITELQNTGNMLRERLYKAGIRVIRYFMEKEALLAPHKLQLQPIELAVKHALEALGPNSIKDSKANFSSDLITDVWKTHSIVSALEAIKSKNTLHRAKFVAMREKYLDTFKSHLGQDEEASKFKQILAIRKQLAQLQEPTQQESSLAQNLDTIFLKPPNSSSPPERVASVLTSLKYYREDEEGDESIHALVEKTIETLENVSTP